MSLNWNEQTYRGEMTHPSTYQLDQKEHIFLDTTAVAPPPSRDYFRLLVTKEQVSLTQWKISHGPANSTPSMSRCNLQQISQHGDITSEVARIFGNDDLDYIIGLSQGRYDWILTLPTPILTRIIFFSGYGNLVNVARVCKRFAKICDTDLLWEQFYRKHCQLECANLANLLLQATLFSWKLLFRVNRITVARAARRKL